MDWQDIFWNIFISLVASSFFWFLSFKLSFTRVIFASVLEKSADPLEKGAYRYRFRMANIGMRDLIEVTVVAKLSITCETLNRIAFLDIGGSGETGFVTVLGGGAPYRKNHFKCTRTLTVSPAESMFQEFSKTFYPCQLQKLAKDRKLRLDDIFEEFGDRATVQIFVYGNDKSTGARKMFTSPKYTVEDVTEGRFCGGKEIKFSGFESGKAKQAKLSRMTVRE